MSTAQIPIKEVVTAGTEMSIGTGDTFTLPPNVAGEVGNSGSEASEAVVFTVVRIAPVNSATPEVGTMVATPAP